MANITLEGLFDKISDAIIDNLDIFQTTIPEHQKVVRDGLLKVGRQSGEKLVLFDKDVIANSEDLLEQILTDIGDVLPENVEVDIGEGGSITVLWDNGNSSSDITDIVYNIGEGNPLNVGQFIDFEETTSTIDSELAKEFLDTNIFELLQAGDTRQQRINKFFAEYVALKGDNPPEFDIDGDGFVDEDFDSLEYSEQNDISYAQTNNLDEESKFITRLNQDANSGNQSKTLQWLRDDLSNFLEDVDEEIETEIQDDRPEYKNKSDGFLKIRNLNQSIIVRKQEGNDIGIENNIIVPADATNDLAAGYPHPHIGGEGPSYLTEGLTITMWVRFLDRTSRGTLFNYGNPLRGIDPKGFRLETYVLGKNEELETQPGQTWGTVADPYTGDDKFFANNDYERFIRLVVYDHIPDVADGQRKLYDSHLGLPGLPRSDNSVPEFGQSTSTNYGKGNELYLLNNIRVPINFTEWYFVVATYNPLTNDLLGYNSVPEYWTGNVDPDGGGTIANPSFTNDSGYGAKCKVEIISRSDLLRARGYKV